LPLNKKNPRAWPIATKPGEAVFHPRTYPRRPFLETRSDKKYFPGIPASGSFYLPRLPIVSDSGVYPLCGYCGFCPRLRRRVRDGF